MSKKESRARRRSRKTRANQNFENFWDMEGFRDHGKWVKHWKPQVTPLLNKDFRIITKKERRYDILWEAHVALMNDKCPGCKKTKTYLERVKSVEEKLEASETERERLEEIIKELTKKKEKIIE